MTRLRPLIIALMILLPLVGAQAQDLPPQFSLALASLSSFLGRPLTVQDLDNWSFHQDFYTNTALGCPYVFGTPRPEGISGLTFIMVYQGVSYDYRVSADGTIVFPCIPEGGGQIPAQPTQPAAQPTTNCPSGFVGYLPPRLQVGGQGRIGTDGTANRLRSTPSVNGTQTGLIQPGETVSILGGPSCEDASHIIWWQVSDNGTVGWTAEGQLPDDYFLAPVGTTLPAERTLINIQNAGSLVPLATIPLAGVSSISFSQDNKLVALGGLSGLEVYDMATLSLNTNLGDRSAPVTAVAFSQDGRYLAYSTQDGKLQVFDLQGNVKLNIAQPTNTQINSLAFSLDQRYLLATGTGSPVNAPGVTSSLQVYRDFNFQPITSLPASSWVRAVAFSPNGQSLAWMDNSVHIIQAISGATLTTLALGTPSTGGLAWRPAPIGMPPLQQIAFADGAMVRLAHLDSNVEQSYVGDPDFFPGAVAFNQDGSLLAAMNVPVNPSVASTVNIFDANTSDLIASTPLQASSAMSFSPDGTLLVIGSNDEVLFLGVSDAGADAVG